jgi:hypothetical protein
MVGYVENQLLGSLKKKDVSTMYKVKLQDILSFD